MHMQLVLAFTGPGLKPPRCNLATTKIPLPLGPSAVLSDQLSLAPTPALSQADYPLIKFWEKKVWKSYLETRKDTSEVQTNLKSISRGGTRSSKGENVMMLYVEDANGLHVDGSIACDMREFARCI
jgi:hypothetical protein